MTDLRNVLLHEFIGLNIRIVDSTDPTLKELMGTVVFETRNTIFIRTQLSIKQVAKKVARKIEIHTNSGVCFISGSSMIGRPEDRISRLNN